jgi:hypothetical protein
MVTIGRCEARRSGPGTAAREEMSGRLWVLFRDSLMAALMCLAPLVASKGARKRCRAVDASSNV